MLTKAQNHEHGAPSAVESIEGNAGTEYERPTIIECPPDAAKADCQGCEIMDACKADIRAGQARKTLRDCARCDVVSRCDAHITGGSWHHRQGCRPIIDAEEANKALALVAVVRS